MDVRSAFLNGDLAEEVYVHQPPGYASVGNEGKVLRLHKALYGLWQAPRAWNAKLDASLASLGFERSPLEHAVYKRHGDKATLLVGVYVDDLIITGTDEKEIALFKKQMHQLFDMSDLGLLSYYLGLEVKQDGGTIMLCQSAYAKKILDATGMAGCNVCHTPMENRLKLSKASPEDAVDATRFRSVVGSLRYLCNSRPDITHAVGMVSRFMEAPSTAHWAAVKQILRYVSGTIGYGCRYVKGTTQDPVLTGFSDSDHASDVDDRKSTTDIVFFLNSGIVTWASQKQKVIALSTCEAEYIAAATATCQGVWLSRLLGELIGKPPAMVRLFADNMSAIELSKNPVHHERSKHIDIRYHFIRECIEDDMVDVEHVCTNGQLADVLTKALGRVKFLEMRLKLGVMEVSSRRQD
jgi:hypothetical protein